FRLGLLQNEDVGVGVFPEGKEVLVTGARFGSAEHDPCLQRFIDYRRDRFVEVSSLTRAVGSLPGLHPIFLLTRNPGMWPCPSPFHRAQPQTRIGHSARAAGRIVIKSRMSLQT